MSGLNCAATELLRGQSNSAISEETPVVNVSEPPSHAPVIAIHSS